MDASTLTFYERAQGAYFPEALAVHETLLMSARRFLTSPHGKSHGATRIEHIKKYHKKNPWRPLRECARNVGVMCRCFACPNCRLWVDSGRPSQATAPMRCCPGNHALKAAFVEMLCR